MIFPAILCGGSGTRLWPLSRKSYPKQFAKLMGEETLFQAAARRAQGPAGDKMFAKPLILTNSDFRFIVTQQLAEIGIDPGAILIEPCARNTAPAILAAALYALRADPDAVVLAGPSDHVLPDAAAFRAAVARGMASVAQGRMVCFGVQPTRPETGYGYLELAEEVSQGAIPLTRFVEKPDRATAQAMLAAGNFLWNSGIFLFRARDMVAAFETHAPQMLDLVRAALDAAQIDLGFLRLAPEAWDGLPDVSIDYAIMERMDRLDVVPLAQDWTDLGGWDAVWREGARDSAGVQTQGGAVAIDCRNSMLRSESEQMAVVGIGLENILVVAMKDAVLVADLSRAQDVKRAVEALTALGAAQASTFPKDHRPWGWFESLSAGDRFQVKRIHVHPGASLSLQSHFHRSEHWVVVEGTAQVTIGDQLRLVTENESVYIPVGMAHRLTNPGKVPMVLIEVQTGRYLGEDDILRLEDIYARI